MTFDPGPPQPSDRRSAGSARRGRPRRTDAPGPTRQQVIEAVVRLAQDPNEASISMRDLARALGVSPKLLYRHVSGKEELIDLAAAAILETWEAPAATLAWPERLTAIMRSARALVRRFPALAEAIMLCSRGPRESPEVARVLTLIQGCFEEAGLSSAEAADLVQTYQALTLGEITLSKAARRAAPEAFRPSQAALDAGFEAGLRYLVAGIMASRGPAL